MAKKTDELRPFSYSARFVRVDGEPEEMYFYHSLDDANKHLEMFLDDDSGLYKYIAVLDEKTMTVLRMLVFKFGKLYDDLVHSATVKLRPEWCSPGEEKYLFRVSNLNEITGRCMITCLNSLMTLQPSEDVDVEMVCSVKV